MHMVLEGLGLGEGIVRIGYRKKNE
jgi:hypothetical protein